jgi:surfeit locus 1 family protein
MRLSRGVPVGRAAVIELRNQHMTYAITWYALSLATAVMFFRLVKRPSRRLTMAEYRKIV